MDKKWMRLALELSLKGKGRTWPNPHVGCVIVKGGKLIAKGFHEKAGFPHAEIEALNRAGAKASGATLYVTLEPCNHQGRTGPCAQAILRAGIRKVVAAAPDPNPVVHGGLSYLRRHGVEIGPWTLRAEAEASNLDFFRASKLGRPWFILKAGATLDGKTALASGESKWITSEAARKDARQFRQTCDAVLVGAGTVLKDNPRLLPEKMGAFVPWRIVLDPRARLTGRERIFKDRHAHRSIWLVGPGLASRRERLVRSLGAEVIKFKSRPLKAFVREAVEWMASRPLRRVLVEGGSQTLGAFLNAGLGDELLLYMAPRLMGGERSKGIFGGLSVAKSMNSLVELKGLEIEKIGPDLRMKGYVHRNH